MPLGSDCADHLWHQHELLPWTPTGREDSGALWKGGMAFAVDIWREMLCSGRDTGGKCRLWTTEPLMRGAGYSQGKAMKRCYSNRPYCLPAYKPSLISHHLQIMPRCVKLAFKILGSLMPLCLPALSFLYPTHIPDMMPVWVFYKPLAFLPTFLSYHNPAENALHPSSHI